MLTKTFPSYPEGEEGGLIVHHSQMASHFCGNKHEKVRLSNSDVTLVTLRLILHGRGHTRTTGQVCFACFVESFKMCEMFAIIFFKSYFRCQSLFLLF